MSENSLYKTTLSKAMALCSRREICPREMASRIESWGITGNSRDKIMNILIKENFINEERYANAFARDKFLYNKWGKIKIASYLRTRNISSEIIKNAIESIDPEPYVKLLKELIENHSRTIKAKNNYDLKAKLMRFGLSKGFESNLLFDIINNIEE